jgi:Leucine-rich repeat (LRR) protein
VGTLSQLRELRLSGNELTPLPPFLEQMTSLQHLDLRDNPLDTDTMQARLRESLPDTIVWLSP